MCVCVHCFMPLLVLGMSSINIATSPAPLGKTSDPLALKKKKKMNNIETRKTTFLFFSSCGCKLSSVRSICVNNDHSLVYNIQDPPYANHLFFFFLQLSKVSHMQFDF